MTAKSKLGAKLREVFYEVIDVELAHVFYSGADPAEAESFKRAIEMQGHRAIIKEIDHENPRRIH